MRESVRWPNCYGGAYDLWTPESVAHPAKMAPGLAYRILDHLEDKGLLRPGDTVLDFMCGTGTTLLCAAAKGYRAIGVELEQRFADFARENVNALSRKVGRELDVTVIEGDARQLDTLLGERGLVGVVSPPYQDMIASEGNGIDWSKAKGGPKDTNKPHHNNRNPTSVGALKYGASPGQIGNLRDAPRVVGVTSPPYAGDTAQSGGGIDVSRQWETYRKQGGGMSLEAFTAQQARHSQGYGSSPGQLGALPDRPRTVAVTSPPWEDSIAGDARDPMAQKLYRDQEVKRDRTYRGSAALARNTYGEAEGQIGQAAGESYLDAMAQVYASAARVCDVLAVVTKNPTRNGALRRLDKDTLALMRETGFTPACYHQAMLFRVEERTDLFGETTRAPKGRLGFFKRMQWAKGAPVSDHEDILIAVNRGEL